MNLPSTPTILGIMLAANIAGAVGLALSGCNERPACQPQELARIEAAFTREAVAACLGKTVATCEAYPAIRAKYQAQREEWIACR